MEHERQWLEANHTPMLGRIKTDRKSYPLKLTPNRKITKPALMIFPNQMLPPRESLEVNEIKQQIKDLTEQIGKLQTSPGQPHMERYCSHCHSCSHNLKECWRRPS